MEYIYTHIYIYLYIYLLSDCIENCSPIWFSEWLLRFSPSTAVWGQGRTHSRNLPSSGPLCSPKAPLPTPLSAAGISTSGMRAGLPARTWARLTMAGRFWTPPPRRRAKVWAQPGGSQTPAYPHPSRSHQSLLPRRVPVRPGLCHRHPRGRRAPGARRPLCVRGGQRGLHHLAVARG